MPYYVETLESGGIHGLEPDEMQCPGCGATWQRLPRKLLGMEWEMRHDPMCRFLLWELEEAAVHYGEAMALTHCCLCEPDVNKRFEHNAGPLRGVERTFTAKTHPTHPEADRYEVQVLVPCGHHVI